VYSTFLQRGYDQILHDVCMQNLHVVFAIDRAGIVGEDGETHHGVFDFSYLSHLPNVTILAPSCENEFLQMLDYAIDKCNGPVFVRYPKALAIQRECSAFPENSIEIVNQKGNDVIIASFGRMLECAMGVSKFLDENGIDSTVVNIRSVKPFANADFEKLIAPSSLIVTIEDNAVCGGAGQYISSFLSANMHNVIHYGFKDDFVHQGTQNELFELYGLTPDKIATDIIKELKKHE